jgi:hypothetical protein
MVVQQREAVNLRLRLWFGFEVPKIDARVEQGLMQRGTETDRE